MKLPDHYVYGNSRPKSIVQARQDSYQGIRHTGLVDN